MPLTFANKDDYDKIDACDLVTTVGLLDMLQRGGQGDVVLQVQKRGGQALRIPTKHSVSKDQAGFILAGSALNLLAKKS